MSTPPAYTPFDWGLPGIQIEAPLNRRGHPPSHEPSGWDALQFTPIGLYDLRRRLGVLPTEPGVFTALQSRFEAADIAFLASGTGSDSRHRVAVDRFFPEQLILRGSLPYGDTRTRKELEEKLKNLIWDMATMWDRAYGGTTLILHADGPIAPNTPQVPEYFKARAYMPPVFIRENPASHLALAHIAQIFNEYVSIPTAARWERAGHAHGYFDNQPPTTTIPRRPHHPALLLPLSPQANYVFQGRPRNELAPLRPPVQPSHSAQPPSSSQDYDVDDLPLDDNTLALLDCQEQIHNLETALAHERAVAVI
ncbi:hypothetical protein DFH06DRAFT_1152676 [Mycena polygramma]|nr:hypothetical protein DFH06DRAFT_1152676 [Mycena polygramma]